MAVGDQQVLLVLFTLEESPIEKLQIKYVLFFLFHLDLRKDRNIGEGGKLMMAVDRQSKMESKWALQSSPVERLLEVDLRIEVQLITNADLIQVAFCPHFF